MKNNQGFVNQLRSKNLNLLYWNFIVLISLLVMGNLGAMIDLILHPEINYFDSEHLIVGGTTAFFVAIMLAMLVKNILRLENSVREIQLSDQKINESLVKWQTTFDGISSSVFLLDPDSTILQANKISQKFFGGEANILGKKCFEVVHKSKCHIDGCPLIKMKTSLKRESMISQIGKKWYEIVVEPILDDENKITGIVHVTTDISDFKFVEESLRKSEEDYRKLFENHSAVKLIIDPVSGKICDANNAAATYYGWSREELKKMYLQQINILPKDQIFEAMYKVKNREQVVFQFQHKKSDGQIRDVEVFTNCITMTDKEYLHSIVIDITERKQAEAEIKSKTEKLVALNTEKDKFFSIISHDLRSPFQGFLSLTEIIAEGASTFSQEDLVSIAANMNHKAANLSNLLKNLFDWAQMQNGVIKSHPKEFSLNALIEESIESLSLKCIQKEITLKNTVNDEIVVYADEQMVNSVLLNLLSNAVKFTSRKGSVAISANINHPAMVEVSVRDTGIGMNEEGLKKLFKLGEKVGTTGTEGELSTGLGLLLCKEFVEMHKGKIWAESEEGKGSAFYFTLPKV